MPLASASAGPAPAAEASDRPAKLTCKAVWKLFGQGAEAFLAGRATPPGPEELAKTGLIGAVRDANMEVGQGEIFVIMGLSGCGKSTLVRCLSRLIEPTAGEILFDGQDLLRAGEREMIEIRRHRWAWCSSTSRCCPTSPCSATWPFPWRCRASIGRPGRPAPAR